MKYIETWLDTVLVQVSSLCDVLKIVMSADSTFDTNLRTLICVWKLQHSHENYAAFLVGQLKLSVK